MALGLAAEPADRDQVGDQLNALAPFQVRREAGLLGRRPLVQKRRPRRQVQLAVRDLVREDEQDLLRVLRRPEHRVGHDDDPGRAPHRQGVGGLHDVELVVESGQVERPPGEHLLAQARQFLLQRGIVRRGVHQLQALGGFEPRRPVPEVVREGQGHDAAEADRALPEPGVRRRVARGELLPDRRRRQVIAAVVVVHPAVTVANDHDRRWCRPELEHVAQQAWQPAVQKVLGQLALVVDRHLESAMAGRGQFDPEVIAPGVHLPDGEALAGLGKPAQRHRHQTRVGIVVEVQRVARVVQELRPDGARRLVELAGQIARAGRVDPRPGGGGQQGHQGDHHQQRSRHGILRPWLCGTPAPPEALRGCPLRVEWVRRHERAREMYHPGEFRPSVRIRRWVSFLGGPPGAGPDWERR